MPILHCRVDERLIHGQVTLGWGGALHPDRYVVVDDALAADEWERELYALATPADAESEFVTVAEARHRLPEWRGGAEGTFLLTRDLDHMLRLAAGRTLSGEPVRLGGIHFAQGRAEVLPYLFLDEGDRERIRAIEREGVRIVAQDLPGSQPVPSPQLLRG